MEGFVVGAPTHKIRTLHALLINFPIIIFMVAAVLAASILKLLPLYAFGLIPTLRRVDLIFATMLILGRWTKEIKDLEMVLSALNT